MGETLKREFSLEGVDTGRKTPDTSWDVPLSQGGGNITVPGTPITRPSFLSAFLANLGPALAGGLASHGAKGEQNFGTGLAGAFGGIESYDQRQFENQLSRQQEDRLAAAQQTSMALEQAQLGRLQQLTPLETQQKQMDIERQQGILNLANQPLLVDQMLGPIAQSLGSLSPDEQAILESGKAGVVGSLQQGKFDVTPYSEAVSKIAQGRIQASQGLEGSGFKAWRQRIIKEKGREPTAKEILEFQTAGAVIRMAGLENLRQDNYVDTTTGTVETKTAGEFAAANKHEPGRFIKYSGAVPNAMKAQSLINDIRDGITQMRSAVNNPKFTLSSTARALMTLASKTPETARSAVIAGAAASHLSGPEQDYVIAHATLLERSMALRALQGQGAGSDQQRAAIANMLPGFATADRNMAQKQLSTLENNVDNVDRAIPEIGKSKTSAGEAKGTAKSSKRRVIDLSK